MEEWVQIHKSSDIGLVIGSFFGALYGAFFGLIGLSGAMMLTGNLLSLAGLRLLPHELDWHLAENLQRDPWGERVLSVLLLLAVGAAAGLFARWGLKDLWVNLLDMLRPTLTYQGYLKGIRIVSRWAHNGSVRYWELTAGDKAWLIAYLDTRWTTFDMDVTPGKEIRVRYLRGTEQVMSLWIKQEHPAAHRPSSLSTRKARP